MIDQPWFDPDPSVNVLEGEFRTSEVSVLDGGVGVRRVGVRRVG